MKFTRLMKSEIEKPSISLNQTGTNFKKNISNNKQNIFKIALMLILSNIFFYMLFSPTNQPTENTINIPPISEGHIRINIFLKNAIAKIDNKTAISIYKQNELLIKKAYLINSNTDSEIQNLTNNDLENDDIQENIGKEISAKLFTIEIAKQDLTKIIASSRESQLWAYPYSENNYPQQRKKYEIIF